MSKADILQQLPNLPRVERREILERIWDLEEADLLGGAQIDPDEKAMLDREHEEYVANPGAGSEWKEVEARLRKQLRK